MTGRPRSAEPTVATSLRLSESVRDRLSAAAQERGVSMNFLVARAVEEFVDRLIPVDEMQWTRDVPHATEDDR